MKDWLARIFVNHLKTVENTASFIKRVVVIVVVFVGKDDNRNHYLCYCCC